MPFQSWEEPGTGLMVRELWDSFTIPLMHLILSVQITHNHITHNIQCISRRWLLNFSVLL